MYTSFNDFNSKEVPVELFVRLPMVETSYVNFGFGADMEESSSIALLGSAGVGLFFSSGTGFTVSYNAGRGSWRYGNLGSVYRFGG